MLWRLAILTIGIQTPRMRVKITAIFKVSNSKEWVILMKKEKLY